MAVKTDTEVIIGGKVLTLSGYESEEYLQRVASYINNKLTEYSKLDGFTRQPPDRQNILMQLNIADDYFKARKQIGLLEEEARRLPTFEEYLTVCRKYGAVPFLECKTPAAGKIVDVLRRYGMLEHTVFSSTVFSFLEEARRAAPEIFLHHIFTTHDEMEELARLGCSGVSWNCPDPAAPEVPERIAAAKHSGVRVCLRAADTPERLRLMRKMKLDYIPTNTLIPGKGGDK